MTHNTIFVFLLLVIGSFSACTHEPTDMIDSEPTDPPPGTSFIEASPQRSGDPQAGYDYLVYGDYVDAGLPYNFYLQTFGINDENLLNRSGDNADINYEYTAIDAFNGVRVVSANCLQCHAQKLNGQLIVGLGNSVGDFTTDQSLAVPILNFLIGGTYGANSPEYEAYEPVAKALEAIGPNIVTEMRGSNPAAKLSVVLAAHRDINDLTWLEETNYEIPSQTIPSDVPAWWLLKKKNAMFYSAGGRGDFARIMMASSILTLQDSTKAREVDNHFADVLAYINSLDAPLYPSAIDDALAKQGKVVFEEHCTSCHGTYGVAETYPNLLVELDEVGTDPLLATSNYTDQAFTDWYNNSWFSRFPSAAQFLPEPGYVAPPLDGIWATAPYLHNGSVPTLADLLESTQRPDYWKRNFNNTSDYDFEKVGWPYERHNEPISNDVFNPNLPGMGNGGHTFGDVLTSGERSQIIEYLKTL